MNDPTQPSPGHATPGAAGTPAARAAGAPVPAIPAEEERLLARVRQSLDEQGAAIRRRPTTPNADAARDAPAATAARPRRRYDEDLIALRDEIGEARLEDVPQLVAQMERLQEVSMTRAELQTILVDGDAPYFGHLRLRESVEGRGTIERDVLIGRATFVDAKARINIVDWRHAPVSQLYYRYEEGSDYDERFGERDVEGEVLVRRTVTIESGTLVRVACPQGVWVRHAATAETNAVNGAGPAGPTWDRTDVPFHELAGGEQTAARAETGPRTRGVLGAAPAGTQRLDRHLPEIAALIDPRQFELITARRSGVAVIQGGAGSGKTTIGLHRLAYLAYNFPEQFPARRMLVVTYGAGLAGYISQILPSLGIEGVRVLTFKDWAEKELRRAVPWLKPTLVDDASPATARVKSHPALLHELERLAATHTGKRNSHAAVALWADLLTDKSRLLALLRGAAEMPVSEADIDEAHRIMVDRVAAVVGRDPRERPPEKEAEKKDREKARRRRRAPEGPELVDPNSTPAHWASLGMSEKAPARPEIDLPEGIRRVEAERDDDDENVRGETGIDGLRTEDEEPLLDLDDVAILLRAHQLLRGVEQPLAHLFVDEAQDLSPMKLSVLIARTGQIKGGNSDANGGGKKKKPGASTPPPKTVPSITLAGDTSQKLFLDNGFGDWRSVLGHLALAHVAIEPLRIAYRSTREILALARHAMGPLQDEVPPEARRSGAPVEAFRFSQTGAAVAFLAEALRDLNAREPRATIALLARHAEQADRIFDGLRRAEVPSLRRVSAQEFTFRPGVDVTDIRQVKGLEFDYVIMLDANASTYGTDDESRHLFHIGVTRAAHQLWLVVTGSPTKLLPEGLLQT